MLKLIKFTLISLIFLTIIIKPNICFSQNVEPETTALIEQIKEDLIKAEADHSIEWVKEVSDKNGFDEIKYALKKYKKTIKIAIYSWTGTRVIVGVKAGLEFFNVISTTSCGFSAITVVSSTISFLTPYVIGAVVFVGTTSFTAPDFIKIREQPWLVADSAHYPLEYIQMMFDQEPNTKSSVVAFGKFLHDVVTYKGITIGDDEINKRNDINRQY